MRVEYDGAVYHVIQRGNNKEFIFDREQDKWFFLTSMEQIVQFYGAEMLAYAIMGNHYHLVVRTGEVGLGQVMHRLNTRYSVYYNNVYERSGHVFQGRYQAILIADEHYLLTAVCYVHRNPVRAGICDRAEDYFWSSDAVYRSLKPSFVKKDLLLNLLAVNENDAAAAAPPSAHFVPFLSHRAAG
jgi:putative transposase